MKDMCQLSNNTKTYIEQYQDTLETMIYKMSGVALTDSISGSFITQMIPHHRAAIAMSENLLCYTTNIPLQNITLNIISSQQRSIENMMAAYPKCELCINCPKELIRYQRENERIINSMFAEMSSAYINNNIDTNFMREMIPHHRGAVRMSENTLQFSICPELVPLLEAIIKSQKEGIRQMEQLLLQAECHEKAARSWC